MMKEVLVLGSHCTRSDYYRETAQKVIDDMGYAIEAIKIVDPELIKGYGVQVGCSNAYCPGCNIVNVGRGDVRYTPALVVDGKVIEHSGLPSEAELRRLLEKERVGDK